ncbi:9978_t:CDS:1, partial [Cetraspora pellucida]
LENLLAATREGPRGFSTQKFSSKNSKKISLMQRKRRYHLRLLELLRIYYNCDRYQLPYRRSQHGQKNDNWMVAVPLVD